MLPAELEVAFGVLGIPWPSQNEDGLRQCADSYRACATTLAADVTPTAHGAVQHVRAHNAGNDIDALEVFWAKYQDDACDTSYLPSLTTILRALADGHHQAANLVEALKNSLVTAAKAVAILLTTAFAGGIAVLVIRTNLRVLRWIVQRWATVTRHALERFFGETLSCRIEARLRRILSASGPHRSSVETASADLPRDIHPLAGLWLTRRSLSGNGLDPFRSITEFANRGDAEKLVAATGKKFDGDYLEYRRMIEEWLINEGRKKGQELNGDIPPLYFMLNSRPSGSLGDEFVTINIPAEAIPAEHMTMTIEDSFFNYMLRDPTRRDQVDLTNLRLRTFSTPGR